jgi:hypothetical protein
LAQPWVAPFSWGGGESERDSGTRSVDQIGGESNVDTEPSGLSDSCDETLKYCNAFVYH